MTHAERANYSTVHSVVSALRARPAASISHNDTRNSFVKVLKEGTCVITVSTADGSNLTAECVITSLSSVEAIFADPNAAVDVYDMNGAMLKKGSSREELKQLKPAIYILRSGNTVVKTIVK